VVAELMRAGIGPVRQAYREASEANRGSEPEAVRGDRLGAVLILLRQCTKVIEILRLGCSRL